MKISTNSNIYIFKHVRKAKKLEGNQTINRSSFIRPRLRNSIRRSLSTAEIFALKYSVAGITLTVDQIGWTVENKLSKTA